MYMKLYAIIVMRMLAFAHFNEHFKKIARTLAAQHREILTVDVFYVFCLPLLLITGACLAPSQLWFSVREEHQVSHKLPPTG